MNIESQLKASTVAGVANLFDTKIDENQVQIQPTRKEFEGEFTIVVFPFVRFAKKSPEQTGELLGKFLVESIDEVESFSTVKGFLNLKMTDEFWVNNLSDILSDESFGFAPADSKPLVMVEYASPNTNKPLHLGHLRNIFLGYSVSEITKAAGHKVAKVQIVNDRGIHICKSMVAWQKFGNGETPSSTGMKGDHLVGKYYVLFDKTYKAEVKALEEEGFSKEEAEQKSAILNEAREALVKWEEKDPAVYELWKTMNGWVYAGFDETYNRMGVDFDKLYFESDTYSLGKDVALKAVEDGVFYKREDGSVWADLTKDGLDEKLILRKDGTSVYMTQDIGTAILRYQEYPDVSKVIYTVGNEQEYHFKVLFLLLEKMGYEWAKECYHLSYGMVELPDGKMKSREGTVVDADDIMATMVQTAREITEELGKLDGLEQTEKEELYESIGLAALKYFLLRVDPKKNMLFNPSESIDFTGNTGPFIQYAHARIQSIVRNFDSEIKPMDTTLELSAAERALQMKLFAFPEMIQQSASDFNPALLANYVYDLTKDFGSFYQNMSILKAETEELKNYRVGLSVATGKVIKKGMKLLGVNVPDRM